MHLTCLLRGPRKWALASLILIALVYHILSHEQTVSLRDTSLTSPFTFKQRPGDDTLALQDSPPSQQILQHGAPNLEGQWLSQSEEEDPPVDIDSKAQSSASSVDPTVILLPTTTLLTIPSSRTLSNVEASASAASSTSATSSFVSHAHTLPSNDAFLSHFSAIPFAPNLTVSDAMVGCQYTEKELTHFQFNGDASWRENLTPDLFIAIRREEWQSYIQNDLIPWSSVSSHFSGRGIVVVAGHPKSIERLKVSLRVLLGLGSTLPVEVHFYGDEIDQVTQQDLLAIYNHPSTKGTRLFFNDLAGADQILQSSYNKKLHVNYQLKTAALINSRFAEPLLLDSDNIPAVDPTELYQSRIYREYGTVFWPDLPRTRSEHPAWAITNTPCRRDEYEFESGQVIVDKRRYFYHLQLAAWWNEQRFWNDILLGDKDTFRFAWHALKTDFGTPKKWITSVGFVAEQGVVGGEEGDTREGYCGHTFAQHHPDFSSADVSNSQKKSGIAFFHGGTLKSLSAPLMTRLMENRGGIFTHYKRSPVDEDWSEIEYDVGLRYWHAGFYYNITSEPVLTGEEDFDKDGKAITPEKMEKLRVTDDERDDLVLCTDMGEVDAKPLSVIGEEGFESKFQQAGGYWAVEDLYRWGRSGP